MHPDIQGCIINLINFHGAAYVCGEGEGLILESALHMGQKLKPTCSFKLDYRLEQKLVAEKLNELRARDLPEEVIASAMSEFGMKRFLSQIYICVMYDFLLWN